MSHQSRKFVDVQAQLEVPTRRFAVGQVPTQLLLALVVVVVNVLDEACPMLARQTRARTATGETPGQHITLEFTRAVTQLPPLHLAYHR
jgi:hypothetical protein